MRRSSGFTPYHSWKKSDKGFTLIELLVVISIIAVLVASVLASLSKARGNGNDTGVKANLGTLQVQATLYYGIGNTYGASNSSCTGAGTVFNDTTTTIDDSIGAAVQSAQKDVNGGASNLVCISGSQTFMVAGKLSDGTYWCVDSAGHAMAEASAPSSTVCP